MDLIQKALRPKKKLHQNWMKNKNSWSFCKKLHQNWTEEICRHISRGSRSNQLKGKNCIKIEWKILYTQGTGTCTLYTFQICEFGSLFEIKYKFSLWPINNPFRGSLYKKKPPLKLDENKKVKNVIISLILQE